MLLAHTHTAIVVYSNAVLTVAYSAACHLKLVLHLLLLWVCLYTGIDEDFFARFVSMDPLNFYQIADHACRHGGEPCLKGMYTFFSLRNLLVGEGDVRILPTCRHHRSYISAFVSYIKGSMAFLPRTAVCLCTGTLTNRPQYANLAPLVDWLSRQVRQLQERKIGMDGYDTLVEFTTSQPKTLPSISQLMLLVLLGKAVAATAKVLLGVEVPLPAGYQEGGYEGGSQGEGQGSSSSVWG